MAYALPEPPLDDDGTVAERIDPDAPDGAPGPDDTEAIYRLAGEAGVDLETAARWIADAAAGAETLPEWMPPGARWVVDDDGKAEWALTKIVEAREQLDVVARRYDVWTAKARQLLDRFDVWRLRAAREPERTIDYMTALLCRYALNRRAATGQASVVLPHGALRTRMGRRSLKVVSYDDALRALEAQGSEAVRYRPAEIMVSRVPHVEGFRWDAVLEDGTEVDGLVRAVELAPQPGDPLAGREGPSSVAAVTVGAVPCYVTADGELASWPGMIYVDGETSASVEPVGS